MIYLSLILTLLAACTKGDLATVTSTEAVTNNSTVNKTVVLQLVNNIRKKGCQCGDTYYPSVSAVTWNDLLEKAALSHSKDMYQNKYFSHTSQNGTNAGVRIGTAGYKWSTYGENIAMGYGSEEAVIAGWISSPGHCKNIMNKSFKEMGVAKVGDYWTQDFGTRN